MKNYCSLQDPVKRLKREATHWEKILTNHISNKGFVSRMYKELFKTQCYENKQSNQKMHKRQEQIFYRGYMDGK